jgi:hypothetical protein
MGFAGFCTRSLTAIALIVIGVIVFDTGQSAPATDDDMVAIVLDSGLGHDISVLIELTAREIGQADPHCPPGCPTGCAHPASVCCASGAVVGSSSACQVVISAGTAMPYEVDQNLSGVEPDVPQEPPQFSA